MSDTPRVHGSTKPTPKDEIRLDAARNVIEGLRRQAEEREFQEQKARGLTVQDVLKNGKEDLNDRGFLDEHNEFVEDSEVLDTSDPGANQNGRTNVKQADALKETVAKAKKAQASKSKTSKSKKGAK